METKVGKILVHYKFGNKTYSEAVAEILSLMGENKNLVTSETTS